MQDLSTYSQIKPQFPEQEHLKCPRCDSSNTKFCYYNNYNLSQPRHFCKNCKRYWTKGGTLRNIPVGGGSRKNTKRSANPKDNKLVPGRNKFVSEDNKLALALEDNKLGPGRNSSSSVSTSTNSEAHQPKPDPDPAGYGLSGFDQDHRMLDVGGSFSSLLVNGQFGSMLEGLNSNGLNLDMNEFGENPNSSSGSTMIQNAGGTEFEMSNNNEREKFLGGGDSSCWNNSANGWPDLAIFTPGSSFQ